MRFVMNPDAAYQYPIWWVGLFIALMGIVLAVLVELAARWVVPVEFRRRHNDVAAAMLSIIGVTYAVLLAFVAMLAWDDFNRAKAASYAEAGLVRDVGSLAAGFAEPVQSALRGDITGYARTVITVEWPAQAEGRRSDRAAAYLDAMDRMAISFRPSTSTEGTLQAQLLQALMRLQDVRQERMAAADSAIPAIVWVVLLLGGGLTIAFSSFLGAPSLAMHLAMASALAVSGALVLVLIVALSNPFRGDFRVSAEPFERVLVQITAPTTPWPGGNFDQARIRPEGVGH
ncbi:MAG TPA: DUF4239 domain-containing protein [Stellaceae bacterium]|nr:DUF4239 domain-containing protein [Stellaceae bacterium]